jgi:hypothetical protein
MGSGNKPIDFCFGKYTPSAMIQEPYIVKLVIFNPAVIRRHVYLRTFECLSESKEPSDSARIVFEIQLAHRIRFYFAVVLRHVSDPPEFDVCKPNASPVTDIFAGSVYETVPFNT